MKKFRVLVSALIEAVAFHEFFQAGTAFWGGVQAAVSKATETRKPSGPKISCKVSRVGLPSFEGIL